MTVGPAAVAADEESGDDAPTAADLEFDDPDSYRVESTGGVVAADEQTASRIGASILEDGGNAADAATAAMLALGVTNPQSSGLGGGGFCLVRPAGDDRAPRVVDFRETAPGDAHRDMYLDDGQADHDAARQGGLAVATPGEPAGAWALHGRFGDRDWEEVVDPAYQLAADGFEIGANLGDRIERYTDELQQRPQLAAVFQDDDGDWLTEGDRLVRSDLAEALRLLRDDGYRPFYHGEIAEAIAESTREADGMLTTDDLAGYSVERREPTVGHLDDHTVYSMPPPSSGGIALAQAFNILDHVEPIDDLDNPDDLHLVVEALKHAFADRARWLGDTDFVDVPVDRLVSADYARQLAERIDPDSILEADDYGSIPDFWDHDPPDGNGTAHVSTIDADGGMVACTNTVNTSFGSMVYVPDYGLVLNNEMADFNIEPGEPNVFGLIGTDQNAVEAYKRPLSSMSPTLVVDDNDRPVMSLGASGGPMIISGVYFLMLRTLLLGDAPLEAMLAPRLHHQWVPDELRVEIRDLPYADELRRRGHEVTVDRIFSAVQLILRDGDRWIGVTDPRKGGKPAAPADPDDDPEADDQH